MRKLLLLLVCMAAGLFTRAQVQFLDMTYKEAVSLANQQGKYLFLDFRADWCKPCVEMEQTTFLDTTLGDYLTRSFLSLKVDVDQFAGMDLRDKFGVNAYPTMVVVDPYDDGVLMRMIGFKTAGILLKDMQYVITLQDVEDNPVVEMPQKKEVEIPEEEVEIEQVTPTETKSQPKKKCFFARWIEQITD